MLPYKSTSVEDTVALGKKLGSSIQSNQIIGLIGDLGTGKTHFSKGVISSFIDAPNVISPTFSILNEYISQDYSIFHFDFYRINHIREIEDIGWYDLLDENHIILVEWADKFPSLFPDTSSYLYFKVNQDGSHFIENK